MAKIFLIEDNAAIREAVASYLKLDDHQVFDFPALAGVKQAVGMQQPDLLILDIMLPDGNGFQFARKLRNSYKMPILFLTARDSESDRITGFEVGGDDYMVKPFSPKELCLRVKAILKRTQAFADPEGRVLKFSLSGSTLTIDHKGVRVLLDDQALSLTTAEWKILSHLAGNPGIVVSRERLLGACLDYLAEGSQRTIDTHVKNIRAKLANNGWIQTVRGFGYRFAGIPL